MAYFSAQLINKSTHNEQLIYFNNFYSKKIKLNENDSVKIKTIHRNHSFATSITIGNFILIVFIFVVIFLSIYYFLIEPISYNDWEILVIWQFNKPFNKVICESMKPSEIYLIMRQRLLYLFLFFLSYSFI